VHFGDTDFLNRYQKFEEHLAEWRTQYPTLSSVDMRYDRQVVLQMQQGTVGTDTAGSAASAAPIAGANATAPAQAAANPATEPAAKAHAAGTKKVATSTGKHAAKSRPHRAAAKTRSRVVHHAAANSRYHSSQVVHP
jgi:cell division protein FtsQ